MAEQDRVFNRLDRIESKVDGLVDVVAGLARIEERSSNQHDAISEIKGIVTAHGKRLSTLESSKSVIDGGRKVIVWLAATSIGLVGLVLSLS